MTLEDIDKADQMREMLQIEHDRLLAEGDTKTVKVLAEAMALPTKSLVTFFNAIAHASDLTKAAT
jgi:hypothetical protein